MGVQLVARDRETDRERETDRGRDGLQGDQTEEGGQEEHEARRNIPGTLTGHIEYPSNETGGIADFRRKIPHTGDKASLDRCR